MAFKLRLEFWKITHDNSGVPTNVLDEVVAPAVEVDVSSSEPVSLPVIDNNEFYAMSVTGVLGTATIEKAAEPEQDPAYGRLIMEASIHWFIVRPGDAYFVTEYA